MNNRHINSTPVAIIGGGIIGLATAWRLARRGCAVTVFERERAGDGASRVAAGMLAPRAEVGFEEVDLLRIGRDSLERYPRFLSELEADSGESVAIDACGTIMVALDRDDMMRIRRLYDFRREIGLPVEWLRSQEAREREPFLSPRVTAAIGLPGDCQVNNRSMLRALMRAMERLGVSLREETTVRRIVIENDAVRRLETNAGAFEVERAIIAAGCWSNRIDGLPDDIAPPVRPVKGQAISLRTTPDFNLTHMVRSPRVYVLPKDDGRIFVGATQEEVGFDAEPTAGPIMSMLQFGWEAVPGIYDLEIDGIEAGLRPGSRDNRPVVGQTRVNGLYAATGHFRSGILHAPFSAEVLTDLIVDGKTHPLLTTVDPLRFDRSPVNDAPVNDTRVSDAPANDARTAPYPSGGAETRVP